MIKSALGVVKKALLKVASAFGLVLVEEVQEVEKTVCIVKVENTSQIQQLNEKIEELHTILDQKDRTIEELLASIEAKRIENVVRDINVRRWKENNKAVEAYFGKRQTPEKSHLKLVKTV